MATVLHYVNTFAVNMLPSMEKSEPRAAGVHQRITGIVMMLVSTLSNQIGAALGALAFPAIGPLGVVAVRQFVAAAVLIPIAPPRFRTLTRSQWWPILLLGLVFGAMNITLYSAIDRLGLALAVTLEFLGPLTVALATSTRRLDAVCGFAAAIGVVVLTSPRPSSDFLGIALGLASAATWAFYILLNRIVGVRIAGLRGTSAAASISALIWVPIAVVTFVIRPPASAGPILLALACGVLASMVPYLADLVTLRRVPADLFGVFMSINPVYAALIGYLILDQALTANEWIGIAIIVASNVTITLAPGRRAPTGRGEPRPVTVAGPARTGCRCSALVDDGSGPSSGLRRAVGGPAPSPTWRRPGPSGRCPEAGARRR